MPKMTDVKSQKIHVDAEAKATTKLSSTGQKTKRMARTDIAGLLTGIGQSPIDPMASQGSYEQRMLAGTLPACVAAALALSDEQIGQSAPAATFATDPVRPALRRWGNTTPWAPRASADRTIAPRL